MKFLVTPEMTKVEKSVISLLNKDYEKAEIIECLETGVFLNISEDLKGIKLYAYLDMYLLEGNGVSIVLFDETKGQASVIRASKKPIDLDVEVEFFAAPYNTEDNLEKDTDDIPESEPEKNEPAEKKKKKAAHKAFEKFAEKHELNPFEYDIIMSVLLAKKDLDYVIPVFHYIAQKAEDYLTYLLELKGLDVSDDCDGSLMILDEDKNEIHKVL